MISPRGFQPQWRPLPSARVRPPVYDRHMTRRSTSPITLVKRQQAEWAARRGTTMDPAHALYTAKLADNLFVPLSAKTRQNFEQGSGDELALKMRALHSSSALAVNVFEHWRQRAEFSALTRALGLAQPIVGLRFEEQFKNGLPGIPPNLDVVLDLADGSIVAIESKFLEPYSAHAHGFKEKYFENPDELWAGSGFANCQALAGRLQSGETAFRWLNAEQLLKHIVGLAKSAKKPWSLWYLWYAVPGEATEHHAAEVAELAQIMAADGIGFRSMTYQELFAGLKSEAEVGDAEYVRYLAERYFDAARTDVVY